MSMTIEHAGMARIRFCDVETRLSMSETTMPLAASLDRHGDSDAGVEILRSCDDQAL
jgi:hypothetical protein